jgi:hypothetical protein
MIAPLRGKLIHKQPGQAIVEAAAPLALVRPDACTPFPGLGQKAPVF